MIPKAQQDSLDNHAARVNISELLDSIHALLEQHQAPEARFLIDAVKRRLWEMKL